MNILIWDEQHGYTKETWAKMLRSKGYGEDVVRGAIEEGEDRIRRRNAINAEKQRKLREQRQAEEKARQENTVEVWEGEEMTLDDLLVAVQSALENGVPRDAKVITLSDGFVQETRSMFYHKEENELTISYIG